jgi:hypothetical protein
MSILNLNAPQGRGPAGKKSLKIWMGVGLLAAVLGFGSTFAASITLNQPGGTTEFGQGVTQTVYCGGDQSVTISPISTYQNKVVGEGTPAVAAGTFAARIVNGSILSANDVSVSNSITKTTIATGSNSSSTLPRFSSDRASAKTGWWLTSPTASSAINPQPSLATVAASPNSYYFAAESSSGKYRKASSLYDEDDRWDSSSVIFRNATAAVEGPVTPASFKVGGVLISEIPLACEGVDFVVSSYAETGGAQTLISGSGVDVKEVAALWTGSGAVTISRDRTALVETTLVSGEQSSRTLKIIFNSGSGTTLAASDLYKLIVETQEDVLS